jgi:hypothetical protein
MTLRAANHLGDIVAEGEQLFHVGYADDLVSILNIGAHL